MNRSESQADVSAAEWWAVELRVAELTAADSVVSLLLAREKTPELPRFAVSGETLQFRGVEDRGFEPLTYRLPACRSPS